jgi:membrane protein
MPTIWRGLNRWTAVRQLVGQGIHDDVLGLAAELAYWSFLSLFPFFIFLAALGGFVAHAFGVTDPTEQLVGLVSAHMPDEAAQVVRHEIEQAVTTQAPGLLSLGIVGALWIASGGTRALLKVMNHAYGVEETRPLWQRYLLALGLTLISALVLVSALVLAVPGQMFGRQVAAAIGVTSAYDVVVPVVRWFIAVIFLLVGTAILYWAAPNLDRPFRWVTPGAILFVLGWLAATSIFAKYVSIFDRYSAIYGALGGVVVLLLWFYLTAFLLLVGAELNGVIDEQIEPERLAEERHRRTGNAMRKDAPGRKDVPG